MKKISVLIPPAFSGQDPIEWVIKYIEELTKQEKEGKLEVLVKYSPSKLINKNQQRAFNGGYLFLQKIYHALGLHGICKETDSIQSALYENSLKISKKNTGVLYYDCTNYFFEIEQKSSKKQYGPSKDHKPNPIVQMGLFMNGNGIPLAFSINKGNTNEQLTLKPCLFKQR